MTTADDSVPGDLNGALAARIAVGQIGRTG